jgi:hypothetical protein
MAVPWVAGGRRCAWTPPRARAQVAPAPAVTARHPPPRQPREPWACSWPPPLPPQCRGAGRWSGVAASAGCHHATRCPPSTPAAQGLPMGRGGERNRLCVGAQPTPTPVPHASGRASTLLSPGPSAMGGLRRDGPGEANGDAAHRGAVSGRARKPSLPPLPAHHPARLPRKRSLDCRAAAPTNGRKGRATAPTPDAVDEECAARCGDAEPGRVGRKVAENTAASISPTPRPHARRQRAARSSRGGGAGRAALVRPSPHWRPGMARPHKGGVLTPSAAAAGQALHVSPIL